MDTLESEKTLLEAEIDRVRAELHAKRGDDPAVPIYRQRLSTLSAQLLKVKLALEREEKGR